MKDDGFRLSASINKGVSFSIVDNISNKSFIYSDGNIISNSLPQRALEVHINNWLDLMADATENRSWRAVIKYVSKDNYVKIQDKGYNDIAITYKGKSAVYTEMAAVMQRRYDKASVVSSLTWCLSILNTVNTRIDPETAVVRVLSDYGLCVWKYNNNVLVHFTTALTTDNTIKALMFNGKYYEDVIIASDMREVKLIHNKSVLAMFPLDSTIARLCNLKMQD